MHPNDYQLIHNLVLHFIQSFSISVSISVIEFKQKDDKYGLAGFAHYILQIITRVSKVNRKMHFNIKNQNV